MLRYGRRCYRFSQKLQKDAAKLYSEVEEAGRQEHDSSREQHSSGSFVSPIPALFFRRSLVGVVSRERRRRRPLRIDPKAEVEVAYGGDFPQTRTRFVSPPCPRS